MSMGKGIATIFLKKFGRVDELKAQGVKIGGCAVLKDDQGDRFIYYLVTKPRYWHKPTYESLRQSLVSMREHAENNSVKAISMPLIGCGLDKLEWSQVKQVLQKVFQGSDIVLTVYRLR